MNDLEKARAEVARLEAKLAPANITILEIESISEKLKYVEATVERMVDCLGLERNPRSQHGDYIMPVLGKIEKRLAALEAQSNDAALIDRVKRQFEREAKVTAAYYRKGDRHD